ncbi:alpha/beta hydrolase-fold protein [Paraglaciecola sp. 2405UD69-4]|uniref:carboxylesterase family protein n=1 Tax=Paraglaciecola sp. 2405UD69-4 TaxID=3391836 RepID=UPI0039C973F4
MSLVIESIYRNFYDLMFKLNPKNSVPPAGMMFDKISFNLKGKQRSAAIFVPENYTPIKEWPLIVFLHGGGVEYKETSIHFANSQLISVAINEYNGDFPAIVLLPLCLGKKVWAHIPAKPIQTEWRLNTFGTESAPNVSDYLTQSIEAVLSKYNIDQSRISLTGHSMGGEGAMRYGAINSNKISAIATSAGSAVIVPDDAPRLAQMNIWMYQGSNDHISTNELARKTVQEITNAGGSVMYKELEGVGHEVGENFYHDPQLIDWLVAQRKEKFIAVS